MNRKEGEAARTMHLYLHLGTQYVHVQLCAVSAWTHGGGKAVVCYTTFPVMWWQHGVGEVGLTQPPEVCGIWLKSIRTLVSYSLVDKV